MKTALILVLILAISSVVSAQPPGSVAVYADEMGGSCNVFEAGFVTLYFFHITEAEMNAVEFVCDVTGVIGWTLLGDISPFMLKQGAFTNFPTTPPSSYGCAIAYRECLTGTIYLGKSNFLVTGATPDCTKIVVKNVPQPSIFGSNSPVAVVCPQGLVEIRGSYAYVNPDETCQCSGTVPVESHSWGQIKSLYK